MSLAAAVKARVSEQLLLELTRQGDASATTVDDDRLDAAVADAAAEFRQETGLALDTSDPAHVAAGVVGAVYYLHAYTFAETAAKETIRQRWERALLRIDVTSGAGRRLKPQTNSVLEASEETTDARPDHDRNRWRSIVPHMPPGPDDDE